MAAEYDRFARAVSFPRPDGLVLSRRHEAGPVGAESRAVHNTLVTTEGERRPFPGDARQLHDMLIRDGGDRGRSLFTDAKRTVQPVGRACGGWRIALMSTTLTAPSATVTTRVPETLNRSLCKTVQLRLSVGEYVSALHAHGRHRRVDACSS
jgi:hypothetical protein